MTICYENIVDLGKCANGFLIVGMWQELENHQQHVVYNNKMKTIWQLL